MSRRHPLATCLSPARVRYATAVEGGTMRYARMFPELPSLRTDETLLHAIGRAGGICDSGDEPDALPSLGETAAGWPFFGQFVAQDGPSQDQGGG
jgi:hypothetical protein